MFCFIVFHTQTLSIPANDVLHVHTHTKKEWDEEREEKNDDEKFASMFKVFEKL